MDSCYIRFLACVLCVTLSLYVTPVVTQTCPDECVCNENIKEMNCSYRGLDKLPILRTDTQRLILRGNNLIQIGDLAFNRLTDLQYLDLSENMISTISGSAFSGLRSLDYLNLANNGLGSLNVYLFDDLVSLQDLDLSSNRFNSLDITSFQYCKVLEKLNLRKNRFTTYILTVVNTIGSLNYLDLSENLLAGSFIGVAQFTQLKYLNVLLMSSSGVDLFSTSTFSGLNQLQRLDLSGNTLQALSPEVLTYVPNLWQLGLNGNTFRCDSTLDSLKNYIVEKGINIFDEFTCVLGNGTRTDVKVTHYTVQVCEDGSTPTVPTSCTGTTLNVKVTSVFDTAVAVSWTPNGLIALPNTRLIVDIRQFNSNSNSTLNIPAENGSMLLTGLRSNTGYVTCFTFEFCRLSSCVDVMTTGGVAVVPQTQMSHEKNVAITLSVILTFLITVLLMLLLGYLLLRRNPEAMEHIEAPVKVSNLPIWRNRNNETPESPKRNGDVDHDDTTNTDPGLEKKTFDWEKMKFWNKLRHDPNDPEAGFDMQKLMFWKRFRRDNEEAPPPPVRNLEEPAIHRELNRMEIDDGDMWEGEQWDDDFYDDPIQVNKSKLSTVSAFTNSGYNNGEEIYQNVDEKRDSDDRKYLELKRDSEGNLEEPKTQGKAKPNAYTGMKTKRGSSVEILSNPKYDTQSSSSSLNERGPLPPIPAPMQEDQEVYEEPVPTLPRSQIANISAMKKMGKVEDLSKDSKLSEQPSYAEYDDSGNAASPEWEPEDVYETFDDEDQMDGKTHKDKHTASDKPNTTKNNNTVNNKTAQSNTKRTLAYLSNMQKRESSDA
ncbi:unnamed protein product [Owenia fusiformis]|uniref:Uncharacterized protein n=1 Tax=Owenia fusiformis TaxID=6347 RepID=A0A8J1TSE3_OWEFU|nr:unnamed protein product [Owenia fusiformis]